MAKGSYSKLMFLFLLYLLSACSMGSEVVELYAVVSSIKEVSTTHYVRERDGESTFGFPSRRLLQKTTEYDTTSPPVTIFPTNPTTTPENPTPTIVTVPSSNNPVTTVIPPNPAFNPVNSIPYAAPSNTPQTTNPANTPVPVINPVPTSGPNTGAQPVTNPATTYPAPTGSVPVVAPPVITNSPAVGGQSYCLAKNGVLETALQAGLNYACGTGADCSQIQQGGNCYNPNTIQNHASYAFNSYYQKNPVITSCDFGGAASLVSTNPSTGSCIYPSSSGAATTTTTTPTQTPSTQSVTPLTATPTPPTTSGEGVPGYDIPPSGLTPSSPEIGTVAYGPYNSAELNTSTTSSSSGLHKFVGCVAFVTTFVTSGIMLDI